MKAEVILTFLFQKQNNNRIPELNKCSSREENLLFPRRIISQMIKLKIYGVKLLGLAVCLALCNGSVLHM